MLAGSSVDCHSSAVIDVSPECALSGIGGAMLLFVAQRMYLYIIIVVINMCIVYDVYMYLYVVHCLYMNVISCGA